MLILNQWRNNIVNIDNMSKIFVENSVVFVENDKEKYILGSYKSNMRAVGVLFEIFKATNKYEMPAE